MSDEKVLVELAWSQKQEDAGFGLKWGKVVRTSALKQEGCRLKLVGQLGLSVEVGCSPTVQ